MLATYTENSLEKTVQINFVKTEFTPETDNGWTYKTNPVKGGASRSGGQIVFAEGGNESNPTSFFTLSGLKSDVTPDKLKAGILYYKSTAIINDSSILDQNKEVSISSGYTLQLSNDVSPQETGTSRRRYTI